MDATLTSTPATGFYYFDQSVRKEGLDLETAISRRYLPIASYGYPAVTYAGPAEYAAPGEQAAAETPSQTGVIYRVTADRSTQ